MICKKHPRYQAVRPPQSCPECWEVWKASVRQRFIDTFGENALDEIEEVDIKVVGGRLVLESGEELHLPKGTFKVSKKTMGDILLINAKRS